MLQYRMLYVYLMLIACLSIQMFLNIFMFLFAIDNINQDPEILPNITLGYHLYDSWSDTSKAVRSVLQILSGPGKAIPNYNCKGWGKLAGVIGDHYSSTTIPIAQILGVYRYTQISYGSTDASLDDRQLYPHFFRTLQSDNVHYLVISKLLKLFGWTWVGILVSNDASGENEQKILQMHLNQQEICVAFVERMTSNDQQVWQALKTINTHAKVVIFCGIYGVNTYLYFDMFSSLNDIYSNTVMFIFPPSWLSNDLFVSFVGDNYAGYLFVDLFPILIPGFEKEFNKPQILKRPEFKLLENWNIQLCSASSDQEKTPLYLKNVTSEYHMGELYYLKPIGQYFKEYYTATISSRVYYAVEAMAKSLHDMTSYLREKHLPLNTDRLKQLQRYMKKLKHPTDTLSAESFFDEFGSFVYYYNIMNCRYPVNADMVAVAVGNYTPWAAEDQQLFVDSQAIRWNYVQNKKPESRCSDICQPGTRKKSSTTRHVCCYDCVPCSEGEISNTTDSENCKKCRDDEWPNKNKDQCIPKALEFLSYSDDISTTFITISVLFCLMTILIMGIFISCLDTPIVRTNNRSLSFVLLVSILLSFLSVFLFLGHPLDITCKLRITTFGINFSIALCSLLVKTIMVYIAFNATKPDSYWRKWIGIRFSNYLVISLSSIQFIISFVWLAVSPPFLEMDTSSYHEKIIIQCNEGSFIGFYLVLGYMGLIAAVSFVLAFMVRTLPDSFNEARNITFSMLVFCSVWITMIPAYLSTRGKYMVAVEIFTILTSSASLLCCIFLPKCYIILLQPDQNTQADVFGYKKKH
ncbi:vomeronasal type-2 receptor 26-like [Gastrophryne carolinensis]